MTDENKQPEAAEEAVEQVLQPEVEAPEAEVEVAEEVDLAAELEATKAQLAEVMKKLAEADIRTQAEMQNVRRRAENDVSKARKFALEKFSKDVLSVADSLERGLGALDQDADALKPARDGLELTLKQLLDVLSRYQVVQVDPQGEPFDPELHEAMTQIPSPDAEPNSVIDVLEKGYTLNGRLLRPARVVVAK